MQLTLNSVLNILENNQMALTRPMLRNLGVTEKETLDAIMDAHGETINPLKDSIKELESDKLKLTQDYKSLEVDKLKLEQDIKNTPEIEVNGNTVSKADYDKLKGEFDTYKTNIETEKTTAKTKSIVQKQLEADGANPKAINLLLKEIDLTKAKIDGDKITNWEDLAKSLKTDYADFFGVVETKGANPATPPTNSGGVLNPFKKENFNLQAQTDLFRNNPTLAAEMAASVGYKI